MRHPAGPGEGLPIRRLPGPSRREVIEGLAAELQAGGIDAARHEAERVLAHVLGLSRTDLLLHSDRVVEPHEAGRIAAISRRRLAGVPLQHIEGTVAFRDLVLVCDGRTLIPRPETEQLVQRIADWAGGPDSAGGVRRVVRPATRARAPLGMALDIGTGSGAIALSLLQEGLADRAVAVDISGPALKQAEENAERLGLEDRIDFRRTKGSPWDVVEAGESFDVIVSNPPYIADAVVETLATEVRDHDPREALAGGSDGLDIIRSIAAGAPAHLNRGGGLFLEIGDGQGSMVRQVLADGGHWPTIRVLPDLAGRDRFVVAIA